MKPVPFNSIDSYDIVAVNGKPYMFTNLRVARETLPIGFYGYDVRDDDLCSGAFAQIKPYIMVNHWGTIIGLDPIPLDPQWADYNPTEEDGNFIGDYVKSDIEFRNRYDELLKECTNDIAPEK